MDNFIGNCDYDYLKIESLILGFGAFVSFFSKKYKDQDMFIDKEIKQKTTDLVVGNIGNQIGEKHNGLTVFDDFSFQLEYYHGSNNFCATIIFANEIGEIEISNNGFKRSSPQVLGFFFARSKKIIQCLNEFLIETYSFFNLNGGKNVK